MGTLAAPQETVVSRLSGRIDRARRQGFVVRIEPLGETGDSWCLLRGSVVLFVDASQTAAEQLRQIDQSIADYERFVTGGKRHAA